MQTGEGEKKKRLTGFPLSAELFFEQRKTVIDLHVTRSAVHLINVVADF